MTTPTRYTLTGPDDVAKLNVGPVLMATIHEQFAEIWGKTPHKIGVHHVQSVLDPSTESLAWEYGEDLALYVGPSVMASFPVINTGCFPHIRVIWQVDVQDGHITYTPELENTTTTGHIDFAQIMPQIDQSLVAFSPFSWQDVFIFVWIN